MTTTHGSQVWYDATDMASADYTIAEGRKYSTPVNILVDAGTGNVQVQFKDKDDAWYTPTDAAYTIDEDALVTLPRSNMPYTRILATGDAEFCVIGDPR